MSNDSALIRTPVNTNFAHPHKFTFLIPNLPITNYFLTECNLPGVRTNAAPIKTPLSTTYRHGDKLEYAPLEIKFLVDEDFRVWEEVYNWLKALTFPHNTAEYIKNFGKSPYQDCVVIPNRNSNNSNFRIKYTNCHPIELGGVNWDTTSGPTDVITATAVIRYDTFIFDRTSS